MVAVRAMSLLRVDQLEMQAPRSRPVVPPHRWRGSRRAYQNHKGKFPQHKLSFPQTEVMLGYTMLIFKLLAPETLCPSSSLSNEIIAGRTDKIGGREGPWLLTNLKHHHGAWPHFSLHFLKCVTKHQSQPLKKKKILRQFPQNVQRGNFLVHLPKQT